jgi:hypothetical protein
VRVDLFCWSHGALPAPAVCGNTKPARASVCPGEVQRGASLEGGSEKNNQELHRSRYAVAECVVSSWRKARA